MRKASGNYLLLVICSLPLLAGWIVQTRAQSAEEQYFGAVPSDPVSALLNLVKSGKVKLKFEPKHGFLVSLLKELGISKTSQLLVFSKSSLQSAYISGSTPRAIYFDDQTYVGWIEGAPNIEIASVDPTHGPMFYLLPNTQPTLPPISRQVYECTQCHDSVMTNHVPGLMARSLYTNYDGTTRLASGSHLTTPRSPLAERWGGWYVTGSHGSQRHMGNETARGPDTASIINMDRGANVMDLSRYLDTSGLLTSTSDIVALMVAEHQMEVQNRLTSANYATRNALRDETIFTPELAGTGKHSSSTLGRIRGACEPLVEAILCSGEVPLTAPISGSAEYIADYTRRYPKVAHSRSLAQLDLQTRLFRFSCSPMIYSSSFHGLPKEAREQVYNRIREVLKGDSIKKPYSHLKPADREAIREILEATIPEFRGVGR